MYKDFFGFTELPFSIVPNARYLYLSQRHKEAILHLKSGLGEGGGFAMLTGEVGTGKTTVAKSMLANLDTNTKAALILNPTFSSRDLLEAICDEFKLVYPEQASLKQLTDTIHRYLQRNNEQGWQTLLVIDEAQHLAPDVLEQLRLLTNLETDTRKLLKVLLVGQPELQRLLQTTQLRQLAQRITGRYHLLPLDVKETADYIDFRLHTAGCNQPLFDRSCVKIIAKYSHGIPRLINLMCDKALHLAYHQSTMVVSRTITKHACEEVMQFQADIYQQPKAKNNIDTELVKSFAKGSVLACLVGAGLWFAPTAANLIEQYTQPQATTNHIAESERSLLMSQTSREKAIADLYNLWGYQSSKRDAFCLEEAQSVMRCQSRNQTWAQVIAAERPVILELNHQGATAYPILYAVSNDTVEVLSGSMRIQLPSEWVLSSWQGQVIDVWSAPIKQTLSLNMQGEAVSTLDQLLALALDEAPLRVYHFDQELKQRVELFQNWQGMNVDGIAGANTLARLQQLVQLHHPSLRSAEMEEM